MNPTTNTSNPNHLTPTHKPNTIELDPRPQTLSLNSETWNPENISLTISPVPWNGGRNPKPNALGLKLRETKAKGQEPHTNKIKVWGGALGVSKYNLDNYLWNDVVEAAEHAKISVNDLCTKVSHWECSHHPITNLKWWKKRGEQQKSNAIFRTKIA